MKKLILTISLAILTIASASSQNTGASSSQINDETTLLKEGMPLPSFMVQMMDGSVLDINSERLAGKVILINFWATWCPPCRAEFTRVQKDIVDRYAGKDFVFVAISRGEDPNTVREFAEKNGYNFPIGLDQDQKIWNLFANNYIPRNFVIGKDGKVAMTSIGYTPKEFDHMIEVIDGLVK